MTPSPKSRLENMISTVVNITCVQLIEHQTENELFDWSNNICATIVRGNTLLRTILVSSRFWVPRILLETTSNSHHSFALTEVDVERLRHAPVLEFVDLQANPLSARIHDLLGTLTRIRIELSPRQVEGWEDLNVWTCARATDFAENGRRTRPSSRSLDEDCSRLRRLAVASTFFCTVIMRRTVCDNG